MDVSLPSHLTGRWTSASTPGVGRSKAAAAADTGWFFRAGDLPFEDGYFRNERSVLGTSRRGCGFGRMAACSNRRRSCFACQITISCRISQWHDSLTVLVYAVSGRLPPVFNRISRHYHCLRRTYGAPGSAQRVRSRTLVALLRCSAGSGMGSLFASCWLVKCSSDVGFWRGMESGADSGDYAAIVRRGADQRSVRIRLRRPAQERVSGD